MAIFYIEILNAASIKSFLNGFYVKNKHNNYISNIKINLINIIVSLYKANCYNKNCNNKNIKIRIMI